MTQSLQRRTPTSPVVAAASSEHGVATSALTRQVLKCVIPLSVVRQRLARWEHQLIVRQLKRKYGIAHRSLPASWKLLTRISLSDLEQLRSLPVLDIVQSPSGEGKSSRDPSAAKTE